MFRPVKSTLVNYEQFPVKLLAFTLVLRGLDVFVFESIYVPDEYWQSLEVAHNLVFGYGYKTWEWVQGVRSYLYVSVVAGVFKLLQVSGLDSAELVILVPRILQGILSAVADVYFVRWIHEKRSGQYLWALLSWLTCYFISFCSTRTLVNTFEMNLTVIALYYYPWSPKSKSFKFILLICLIVFARPTAALVWLPLVLINVFSSKTPVKYVLTSYVPVFLLVGALSTGLDSYFHGSFVFTPWNFFKVNVLENVSLHYGGHSHLWFLYCGIPAVLGLHTFPFYLSFVKNLLSAKQWRSRLKFDVETQMVITIVWSLLVLSIVPHKEFRFLLPLVPMMLYLSSNVLRRWSSKAATPLLYLVAGLLITSHVGAVTFLGRMHQVAGLEVMSHLRHTVQPDAKLLFLLPCHRLPLYSHLHTNVSTRFLTCEPPIGQPPSYKDEADQFFENPRAWLKREYTTTYPCSLPTHIIAYSNTNITNFLHVNNYTEDLSAWDSMVQIDPRASSHIKVHRRPGPVCNL